MDIKTTEAHVETEPKKRRAHIEFRVALILVVFQTALHYEVLDVWFLVRLGKPNGEGAVLLLLSPEHVCQDL